MCFLVFVYPHNHKIPMCVKKSMLPCKYYDLSCKTKANEDEFLMNSVVNCLCLYRLMRHPKPLNQLLIIIRDFHLGENYMFKHGDCCTAMSRTQILSFSDSSIAP